MINQATISLSLALGRQPTITELADSLQIDPDICGCALRALDRPVSLNAPAGQEGAPLSEALPDADAGDPIAPRWCGHHWSPWSSIPQSCTALSKSDAGLYRLRAEGAENLLYIGEGNIAMRLNAHLRKARLPKNAQGSVFAAAGDLECSYAVESNWTPNQRLELETDLTGAYVRALRRVPAAQFLGRSSAGEK